MEEIILKRSEKQRKPKRSSVTVKPATYIKVYETAQDVGITVESLVDLLLTKALEHTKVVD